MKIKNHDLSKKTFIVAEIGNNHEGSYSLAEEMLGLAHEAGADGVKFQTFVPELFVSSADPARMERMKKFQLSFNEFEKLSKLAKEMGVTFFSTPLDLESAKFLNTIQDVFKVASADNSFFQLLELIATFGKPTIISTGLGNTELLHKVRQIILNKIDKKEEGKLLAFLHCVSAYPVPVEQVNLSAIKTLQNMFPNNAIGYSDHTIGIDACIYAVAAGAKIIEKHFTIDKNYSEFRDHQLSADPTDMKNMVNTIRNVETMNGNGDKISQACEEALRPALRRSIAAAVDLEAGTIISNDHIIWLRPGTGFLSGEESKVIGKKTTRYIHKGELISPESILNL